MQLFGIAVLISAAQAISLKLKESTVPDPLDVDTVLYEVFRNSVHEFPKKIQLSSMGSALHPVSQGFYNYFHDDFPVQYH